LNLIIVKDLEDDEYEEHKRLNVMSLQLGLMQRIMKEAVKHALKKLPTTLAKLQSSISQYETEHNRLVIEADEITDRTGREDIRNKLIDVASKWSQLKQHVYSVAGIQQGGLQSSSSLEALRQASVELAVEINDLVDRYSIADPPDFPPKEPGPPWTLIIYSSIAGGVLMMCVLACWSVGLCKCGTGDKTSSGAHVNTKKSDSKKKENAADSLRTTASIASA